MKRTILAAFVVVLGLVAFAPGARAASCTDTWNGGSGDWDTGGEWTSGVPAAGANVCIPSGAVTLSDGDTSPINVASLSITGGSLTVDIHNVLVSASTTISPDASVTLNGSYNGANAGNASLGGGPVLNQGTITMEGSSYSATLYGTVTNQGTIDVPFGSVSLGQGGNGGTGSLVNEGTISVAAPTAADTGYEPGIIAYGFPITNAGGTIANGDTFVVYGESGTTGSFTEGAGTVTGNPINFGRGSSLSWTGAGASSFSVGPCVGAIPMSGSIAPGQSLDVEIGSAVEEAASFSSAGSIALDGTYQGSGCGPASVLTDSGTFTNTGAMTIQGTPYSGSLTGAVVNQGTIAVTPGAEFEQASGSFVNAASGVLEPEISSSAFGQFEFDSGTTLTAGGTLAPTLEGGFVPTVGQTFEVIRGAALSGQFGAVRAPFGADYGTTGQIQAVYGAGTSAGGGAPAPAPTHHSPAHLTGVHGARGAVRLTFSCPAGAARCTSATVRATVGERLAGRNLIGIAAPGARRRKGIRTRVVSIATGHLSGVSAGHGATLTLRLNGLGRRLLARFGGLPATVTVTEGTTRTVHRVEVLAPKGKSRRRRRG